MGARFGHISPNGHVDLTGTWVTLDALHTQTETAKFLVEAKKAHFIMTVKANQPTLYAACRSLPRERATVRHSERNRGHGRLERGLSPYCRPTTWTFPTSHKWHGSTALVPTSPRTNRPERPST